MKTFFLGAVLAAASLTANAYQTNCADSYLHGTAPVITNAKLAHKTKALCFQEFAVVHSGISRTALWSAEHLTADRVKAAREIDRVNSFHAEERLDSNDRAELADYAHQRGLDRGHLAPSGDMATPSAQLESFSLGNVVAQNAILNRHLWADIEKSVRRLAEKRGDIYTITGPLFSGGTVRQLNGRVLVPTRIFKIVVDTRTGRGAAYVADNEPVDDYSVMSIAELEQVAGINFFPGMSDAAKRDAMPLPRPTTRGYSSQGYGSEEHALKSITRSIQHLLR
ncbi:hypothetical protein BSFA1_79600 (plasmid) [Burkholderia sp. SFA1]|nr:DNA/RNA non-specific endonuclease [Burkholderia sp. YI23]BBQ02832.1 hypothetical protein BSFA1_79600 [Burkholderia sp. SFA1]